MYQNQIYSLKTPPTKSKMHSDIWSISCMFLIAARRSNSSWSGDCHRTGSEEWADGNVFGASQIPQTVRNMSQWGTNRNPWVGYRITYHRSPRPLLTPEPGEGGGVKVPFQISVNLLEIDDKYQYSTFDNTLVGCEVMSWTIVQLSSKPQMGARRSSTIHAVVERPHHHCGDDLVL